MSQTSPRAVKAAVRQAEAVQLRIEGLSYREIAQRLGYRSPSGAYDAVIRGLEKLFPVEEADKLRKIEAARLDRLLQALWPEAVNGNLAVVDRVLRIMERRARLLGLDKAMARAAVVTSTKDDGLTWDQVLAWLTDERESDGDK